MYIRISTAVRLRCRAGGTALHIVKYMPNHIVTPVKVAPPNQIEITCSGCYSHCNLSSHIGIVGLESSS